MPPQPSALPCLPRSTDGGGIQHTATCEGSSVLSCGQLDGSMVKAFDRHLQAAMAVVAERKGDARSAALGRQGHQKTPAMVAAAVQQALAQTRAEAAAAARSGSSGPGQAPVVPEAVPQGGFTDVGLHTGGLPRDTAWPLVREAVRVSEGADAQPVSGFRLASVGCRLASASCSSVQLASAASGLCSLLRPPAGHAEPRPRCRGAAPDLFVLAEAHLHLWLMQRQVALLRPELATARVLSAAMLMLQAVAGRAAALAEAGHAVEHFEAACASARAAIEAAQAERMQAAAEAARLPPLAGDSSPCGPGSWRLPRGTLPPVRPPQRDGGGREAAVERQDRNLGCLPLPTSVEPSFAALLEVLQSHRLQQEGDRQAQHALCLVERRLFGLSASGFQEAWSGLVLEAALVAEVDALVEVVEAYRSGEQGMGAFRAAARSGLIFWLEAGRGRKGAGPV